MNHMPEDFSELESRLTDTARASLERAGMIAQDTGSPYVGTEHVLLGVSRKMRRWAQRYWQKVA